MEASRVRAALERYRWPLLIVVVGLVVWALARWLPPAYDFHVFFRPVVWDWLQGQSPYEIGKGFYNPPWMLLCLLPFALPPEPVGRALLLVFSVVVIAWGLRSTHRRRAATVLTMVSFPSLALFWSGQIEALPLLGVCVGSWAVWERRPWVLSAGLLLMTTKPQETWLIVLLLLWRARHWRWKEWLRIASLPAAALVFSVTTFGLDWLRALLSTGQSHRAGWNNISWAWRVFGPSYPGLAIAWSLGIAAVALGLSARRPLTPHTLALTVTASAIASPYVTTHHLVLPLVLAWPHLLDRQPLLALPVYLTSLTPLVRWAGDQGLNWLDFLFPVTLMLALLLFHHRQRVEDELGE